jgi:hypothetical protein
METLIEPSTGWQKAMEIMTLRVRLKSHLQSNRIFRCTPQQLGGEAALSQILKKRRWQAEGRGLKDVQCRDIRST